VRFPVRSTHHDGLQLSVQDAQHERRDLERDAGSEVESLSELQVVSEGLGARNAASLAIGRGEVVSLLLL
jgi:hypothetical protein